MFYCPVVSCSFQSSLCYKDLLSGFKWGLFADDKLGEEGGTLKREAFCVPALLTSSATAVQKPEKFTPNRQHWGFFLFFTPLAAKTVVEIIYLGEVLEKISVFFSRSPWQRGGMWWLWKVREDIRIQETPGQSKSFTCTWSSPGTRSLILFLSFVKLNHLEVLVYYKRSTLAEVPA